MVELDFAKGDGLVPVVAQDADSGQVLMVAYTNRETWQLTLQSGIAHYWSRSRQEVWKKGATSGNVQRVKEVLVDCDADTVLLKVEQVGGAACHLGYSSCFFRRVTAEGDLETVAEPVRDPQQMYKKS